MKIKWLESLFFKKTRTGSKLGKMLDVTPFIDKYPPVSLSEEMNNQAYNVFFLIDNECTDKLVSLIEKHTKASFKLNLNKKAQMLSNNHLLLKVNVFSDFNGNVVHLITDSTEVIDDLINADFYPPDPNISFPDIDPLEYGSLQGNIDFWFNWLWLPYFKSLSENQKRKLQLSANWEMFISERLD